MFDGFWLTRGRTSTHGTAVRYDYATGQILAYGHKSVGDNWDKTSKSMEGNLLYDLLQLKDLGFDFHAIIMDEDGTSALSVYDLFPGCELWPCGNHAAKKFH